MARKLRAGPPVAIKILRTLPVSDRQNLGIINLERLPLLVQEMPGWLPPIRTFSGNPYNL